MEKFKKIKSVAAPLMKNNIDTDIIIPMHRYMMAEKDEIHAFAFEPLRFSADGEKNLEFVLNQSGFEDAKILLVGQNFGCGSSREAAVWALKGLGIKCIIGSSFGNIFFNNCFENGILVIHLSIKEVTLMVDVSLSGSMAGEFIVDLEKQIIIGPNHHLLRFKTDAYRRSQLLQGLDSIDMVLRQQKNIEEFRSLDKSRRPWVYL